MYNHSYVEKSADSKRNKELAHLMIKSFNDRDWDTFRSLFSPECHLKSEQDPDFIDYKKSIRVFIDTLQSDSMKTNLSLAVDRNIISREDADQLKLRRLKKTTTFEDFLLAIQIEGELEDQKRKVLATFSEENQVCMRSKAICNLFRNKPTCPF